MSTELNDKELFESAIADTPAEETVTQEQTPEPESDAARQERERDERGRFVAKAEETPAEPVAAQQEAAPQAQPNEAHVPSWRLREVNEAKEAAERRARELEDRYHAIERQFAEMKQSQQKPQEPVDWFTDPNAAIRQNLDPVRQDFQMALASQRNQFSEMLARQSVGDAKIEEVKKWVSSRMNDPVLSARVEQSPHPWGELIRSYDEQKTLSEIGGDINSFRQKVLDDAMKDPAFQAKVVEMVRGGSQAKPNTVVQLPPSLNKAAAASSPYEDEGDMSDRSLFANAMK
jgi:hypothetical protein